MATLSVRSSRTQQRCGRLKKETWKSCEEGGRGAGVGARGEGERRGEERGAVAAAYLLLRINLVQLPHDLGDGEPEMRLQVVELLLDRVRQLAVVRGQMLKIDKQSRPLRVTHHVELRKSERAGG